MMDSSDLYFYLFVIAANVAVALLGVLWTKIKGTPYGAGIEAMAKTLVYAAAQQLPGESGAAKLDWVLAQAAQLGGLNKKQLAYFRLLVEEKVKELKLAEQAAQPVLIDATVQPGSPLGAAELAGAVAELAPAVASGTVEVDENVSGWGGPFTGWRSAQGPIDQAARPMVIIPWAPDHFA